MPVSFCRSLAWMYSSEVSTSLVQCVSDAWKWCPDFFWRRRLFLQRFKRFAIKKKIQSCSARGRLCIICKQLPSRWNPSRAVCGRDWVGVAGERRRKAVRTWQQWCGAEGCRGLLEAVFSVRTFYLRNTAWWEAPGPGSHISLHSNPDFTSDLPRPHLLDLLKIGKNK